MNDTIRLKNLLTPHTVGHTKIHIGPKYDGGYVLSKNTLDNVSAIYSLGIGSECGFDLELAELGYPIYMYESASPRPPREHLNFFYKQMFMNAGNLKSEIINNNHLDSKLLLAMDIEGGEYDIFLNLEYETLRLFKQITFEIHDVLYNNQVIPLLEKLNSEYCLIHIHTNNNCIRPNAYSSGMVNGVPNVLELTYIHKSEYSIQPKIWEVSSPIEGLDFKNQLDLDDVELNWWLA